MAPNRAPKQLKVLYIENSYLTNRENKKLVNNKLLAQLQNLKSSKTFKGENISKILPKREGSVSSLTIFSSKMLKKK